MHRWRQFAKLPPSERRLLAQASLYLPLTGAMLRLLGFARCQTLLSRIAPPAATPDPHDQRLDRARTAARLVRIAADRGFYRATCLPQSLVLWCLVRRQGSEPALHVGVRKVGDRVEAHAWVEYEGVALNDDADVHERFAAFDRAIVR